MEEEERLEGGESIEALDEQRTLSLTFGTMSFPSAAGGRMERSRLVVGLGGDVGIDVEEEDWDLEWIN